MGKKPLLTLAGLFLASVAVSATGCGQCTQCSTRPGKFGGSGPQAKAATPAVGDNKRTDLARDTGKKPGPPPVNEILPVGGAGFEKMPNTTPMKNVPNTYSGDPAPGPITPPPAPNLPGREMIEGSTISRHSMEVPPMPTRTSSTEGIRGKPVPPSNLNSGVPGLNESSETQGLPTGFPSQPVSGKEAPAPQPPDNLAPPAPPAPLPKDTPARPSPLPPPLPPGVIPSTPVGTTTNMTPPPPQPLPGETPEGTRATPVPAPAPAPLPGALPGPVPEPGPVPGSLPPISTTPISTTPGKAHEPRPAKPSGEAPGATPPNLPGETLPPLGS
jgi:hypothetical protein